MRTPAAAVPVPRAYRPVGGGAHVAVAGRLSVARLSAVRVGPVTVPERSDRRTGRHTHLTHAGHAAGHRRPGAHRLQIRPRLTRARGPRANGLGQRDRAELFVHGAIDQSGVDNIKRVTSTNLILPFPIDNFLINILVYREILLSPYTRYLC